MERSSSIVVIRNIKGNSYQEKLGNINSLNLPYPILLEIHNIFTEIKDFLIIYQNNNMESIIRRNETFDIIKKYIKKGEINKLKLIFEIYPNYVDTINSSAIISFGNDFIHETLIYDKYEITEYLLEIGINFNPLILFATIVPVGNNYNYTQLLLDYGADPNVRDAEDGETVLQEACANILYDVVELLLYYGADPNIPDYDGDTALMYTADINIKRLLLYYGADPNIQNNDGDIYLMTAVKNNNIQMVELLLDNGADPNIQNNDNKTAIIYAIQLNNNNIENLLNNYEYNYEYNSLKRRTSRAIASNIQGNYYQEKVNAVNTMDISNQSKTSIINVLKF